MLVFFIFNYGLVMRIYLIGLFFVVAVFYGQIQKKRVLTAADYGLWESFTATDMSKNGQWFFYGLQQQAQDTLFLYSVASKKRLDFPNANWASFSPKSKWFAFYQLDSLYLLDLKTQKRFLVNQGVSDYFFSKMGTYLLVFLQKGSGTSLQLLDLKSMQSTFVDGITSYVVSPDKQGVAFVTKNKGVEVVKVLTLNTTLKEAVVLTTHTGTFNHLKWDSFGNKLAFFEEKRDTLTEKSNLVLHWCTGFDATIVCKTLDVTTHSTFPKGSILAHLPLYLSESNDKVFFTIQRNVDSLLPAKSKATVQIWKSDDLTIPPKSETVLTNRPFQLYLWDVETDTLMAVEDASHPCSIPTGDARHALVYDPEGLAKVYKSSNEILSLFVKDLASGKKQPLLAGLLSTNGTVLVSPAGKYITYFKENEWWVYAIDKQTHYCLTQGMGLKWHRLDYDKPNLVPPTFPPAWTPDDEKIIVYDQYDIWLMKPDGSTKKRLTNGAKMNTVYRIHPTFSLPSPNYYSYGFLASTSDLRTPILLKTINEITLAEGFALLHPNGKIQQLVTKESGVHLLSSSEKQTDFLFMEHNFSLPPRILHVNSKGKETVIYQSNPQQSHFHWGKSKLVHYTTSDGKPLKGALFYPEDYDSTKTYPLLVSIYEKKAKELFDYTPPSLSSNTGFTITNYVTDGYFVLYPDISYEVNMPGTSALNCVTAAVSKVVTDYPIASSSIGLLGHSFGGYEVAYIMGQTDLFKTAVVGAPAIDLLSNYLTLDGHGKSNMWRYELDQMRITAPFYSDVFTKNSPLNFVHHIDAPILIWTGTADLQVDWKNSMKFYTALWRLGKKSTLLVYPNEEHVFAEAKNQLDLSGKIKDWLDYYLKGKGSAGWMEEGFR